MPSSASMATALSWLAISLLLAFVDGCSAAETSATAFINGFLPRASFARRQNTGTEASTQRAKPACSCRCNDLFGPREIPESCGSPARTCRPGATFCAPGAVPGSIIGLRPWRGAAGRSPGRVLFQEWMVLRQLFGVPDGEFVSHGDLGDLVFGQGLNDSIVDQQSVYVPELLTRGICGLELHRAPALRILDACEQCRLEQFRFVFQFFHRDRCRSCPACA